jgi:4-aminobutyrate aminotransferase / (S)-3-amino-2-methylpropionate transaminase / 5-aminovalerate transaminase
MPLGTPASSPARTKALFDDEQQFIAPGLQTIALQSELAIAHGRGCWLTDYDGRRYLDLNAGVSVASLGHAHPRYVAALTRQLEAVSVGSFTSQARAALVRLLAELAPGNLTRTQLFSGGAEAVEAAIRLARSFTKRTDIIGFTGGFHGKTLGVLPLSDVAWKQAVGPLPGGYHLAQFPDTARFAGTPAECLDAAIASLRRVIEQDAGGTPAAVIVEPIQGTAGNIIPPDGFLARVRALAHEHGALFIADEMITGFGRTGDMFASMHDNAVPDILTMGKGMAAGYPVAGVISTDEIVAAEPYSLPSASSSSYGGNPLASAAALVTIETIVGDRLADNARRVGRVFVEGLAELAARHPHIAHVRGRGLLAGFDLVEPGRDTLLGKARCVEFFKYGLAEGVILMSYTPRVRIHPPLIITEDEARQALAMLDRAFVRLEQQ